MRKYMISGRWSKALLMAILLIGSALKVEAQTISLEDVLKLAEQRSASIQASILGIESVKMREKTAFNLYQPQLLVQAPTSNFYTLGIQQNFDFPSVYSARKKLLQSHTDLASASSAVTRVEVRYMISELYVQWQSAEAKLEFYQTQLVDYASISEAATRSFQAGQIDALEKSFAELKFQEAARKVNLVQSERNAAKQSLLGYIGMDDTAQCDSLAANLQPRVWGAAVVNSTMLDVAQAEVHVSEQQLKVEKRQNLPGFFLGYMNQGERNSTVSNRFNGGISIPLWFWHTSASSKAAKLEVDMAQRELLAMRQEIDQVYQSTLSKYNALTLSINIMRMESMPTADALITNAKRMSEAGEISISEYLRSRGDVGQTYLAYLGLLQELLQAQNQLQFITTIQ